MKKFLLTSAIAALCATPSVFGQKVLLDEGFEGMDNTDYIHTFPQGWTTEDSYNPADYQEPRLYYNWTVAYSEKGNTMNGKRYACVDGPTYDGDPAGGTGPRIEKLITPALDLDNTYRLTFNWKAAYHSAIELREYDLHVDVIDMADNKATRIFTFSNEQQLRDSGVPCDIYDPNKLWTNWGLQTSSFDLSQFEGKKIKIAFVYEIYKSASNVLYLDEIKVEQAAAETAPIAQISDTQYNFGNLYIGSKMYSTAFTIKNIGKSGLKITGFDAPQGMGVSYNKDMELSKNQEGQFQLWYEAQLATPAEGVVTLKTNGGDVDINVKASKTVIPTGYQAEFFEGSFPPPGWSTEWWSGSPYALEGDQSACGRGFIEDTYLYAPRLDLSAADAPTVLRFTYFNDFTSMDGDTYAGNDITVEVSTDGGQTWPNSVWTTYGKETGIIENVAIDLKQFAGNDDVRVRWKNSALYYDPEYGADESSTFYLDCVLLPSVYGMNSTPIMSATPVAPSDAATNVLPRSITFEWTEAQFAEGYKFYLGSASGTWDTADGTDLKNVTTHTVTDLGYDKTYYWKVVAYNAKGDAADVPVWSFTTQPDNTVTALPWTEGFEGDVFPPLGWETDVIGYSKWSQNSTKPFDGSSCASVTGRTNGDEVSLTSPDINLPADTEVTLSFWWGNDMAVALISDVNNVYPNPTSGSNNEDEIYMEIYSDGAWKELAMLSDPNPEDERHWIHELIDLTEYAGKTVALRWRYRMLNYNRANGASLDKVQLNAAGADMLEFSTSEWNAYKVNYRQTKSSKSFALNNFGTKPVKVKDVSFDSDNFSANLTTGTEIQPNTSANFRIRFDAMETCSLPNDSVEVKSTMTVKMDNGAELNLPVRGLALGKNLMFYDFEDDETGKAPAGFTTFDDNLPTNPITFWTYPNKGAALSFFVLNENECYHSMKCPVGEQALMSVCSSTDAMSADDWLVSQEIVPGPDAKIKFDARSWESVNSVLPGTCSKVSVWVTEGDATDKNSFEQVGSTHELSLYDNKDWEHLTFDISKYAGKKVHVAMRNVISGGLGSFFDNLEFSDINVDYSGIETIDADISDIEDAEIYTVSGIRVSADAETLPAGIYVVKANGKTTKVIKQ